MGFLLAGWRFPRSGAKNIPWTSNSPIPTILWPRTHRLTSSSMDPPPCQMGKMPMSYPGLWESHVSQRDEHIVLMLMNQKDLRDS